MNRVTSGDISALPELTRVSLGAAELDGQEALAWVNAIGLAFLLGGIWSYFASDRVMARGISPSSTIVVEIAPPESSLNEAVETTPLVVSEAIAEKTAPPELAPLPEPTELEPLSTVTPVAFQPIQEAPASPALLEPPPRAEVITAAPQANIPSTFQAAPAVPANNSTQAQASPKAAVSSQPTQANASGGGTAEKTGTAVIPASFGRGKIVTVDYPPESKINGEQGTLLLEVSADGEGRLQAVKVAQSSGYRNLDLAALRSVRHRNSRFPEAANSTKIYEFEFKLE